MKDNQLKKVHDEATILGLFSTAKEQSAEVYIWKFLGSKKHLAQVRIEAIRKQRNDFCIVPSEGQDRAVQEMMSGQTIIDLYIPSSALVFRCTIRTTDAPFRYYLRIPEFVAQAERRKDMRLNVHDSQEVKVSFGKTAVAPRQMTQHFFKDCFDVSAGGFSFYISKMETKFFQAEDLIPQVELKAGSWATKAKAQITAIREVEPDEFNGLSYKVWRVSCQFENLDQISKKYIEKFIFERIKDELHAINE